MRELNVPVVLRVNEGNLMRLSKSRRSAWLFDHPKKKPICCSERTKFLCAFFLLLLLFLIWLNVLYDILSYAKQYIDAFHTHLSITQNIHRIYTSMCVCSFFSLFLSVFSCWRVIVVVISLKLLHNNSWEKYFCYKLRARDERKKKARPLN